MDLKNKSVLSSEFSEVTENGNPANTALWVDCFGYDESKMTRLENSKSSGCARSSNGAEDDCELMLGVEPTPATNCSDYLSARLDKNRSPVPQGILSKNCTALKHGLSQETKAGLGLPDDEVSEPADSNMPYLSNQVSGDEHILLAAAADEGSTSAKKSGGYVPSLLLGQQQMDSINFFFQSKECTESQTISDCMYTQISSEPSVVSEYHSMSKACSPNAVGISLDQRIDISKIRKLLGLTKVARGASGLCIGHGGGQRCQKLGCTKGAETRSAHCKAHGGGRRCERSGCTKSAYGKVDYCIAHGGGRRCGYPGGCSKAVRGKSGLCIRHGGGKRCQVGDCCCSAEGRAGLCISHGGGRRCQFQGCTKGAHGSTMFCKAHGGGKRCIFAGCAKGAEGSTQLCKGHGGGKRCLYNGGGICPKSVHGGTNFCVAHGGGKRCAVKGCTKSARGRTDCCVRHGGGKRCQFDNCGKSAQGSTDFCKAHGRGKRCAWGEGECKGDQFARGRIEPCAAHLARVQGREANMGGIVSESVNGLVTIASTDGSSFNNICSCSGASIVSDLVNSLEKSTISEHLIPPQVLVPISMKSQASDSGQADSLDECSEQKLLIPHQVLVPLSMKSPRSDSELLGAKKLMEETNGCQVGGLQMGINSLNSVIPEGRVHGGCLMSLFGGNLNNAIDGL